MPHDAAKVRRSHRMSCVAEPQRNASNVNEPLVICLAFVDKKSVACRIDEQVMCELSDRNVDVEFTVELNCSYK